MMKHGARSLPNNHQQKMYLVNGAPVEVSGSHGQGINTFIVWIFLMCNKWWFAKSEKLTSPANNI